MENENASCENKRAFCGRLAMAAALVACLVALVAGIQLTYSAYTANGYLKSVAATGSTQSLFASDMLMDCTSLNDDAVQERPCTVYPDENGTCSFTFQIYNCLLDDRNVVNEKDVTYTLSVDAANINAGDWSISPAQGVPALGEKTTLRGSNATVNSYTLTFPKSALDAGATFTIKATVDSANSPGTTLAMLAAKVVPMRQAMVQGANVSGAFVADTSSQTIDDYDAYDYRVVVSGMETKVTLTWNANEVELEPYFSTQFKNNGSAAQPSVRNGQGSVTFDMVPGSAVVSFFNVGTSKPSDWDALAVSVGKASAS